jgi:hypothetical protein
MSEVDYSQQIYEKIEQDFEWPMADKALNSLFLFQVNFNDLKKALDFLIINQKKQQFVIQQLIDKKEGQDVKTIEIASKDYDSLP